MIKINLSRVFEKSLMLILLVSFFQGNVLNANAQTVSSDPNQARPMGGGNGHPGHAVPPGLAPPPADTGDGTTTGVGSVSGTGPGPATPPATGGTATHSPPNNGNTGPIITPPTRGNAKNTLAPGVPNTPTSGSGPVGTTGPTTAPVSTGTVSTSTGTATGTTTSPTVGTATGSGTASGTVQSGSGTSGSAGGTVTTVNTGNAGGASNSGSGRVGNAKGNLGAGRTVSSGSQGPVGIGFTGSSGTVSGTAGGNAGGSASNGNVGSPKGLLGSGTNRSASTAAPVPVTTTPVVAPPSGAAPAPASVGNPVAPPPANIPVSGTQTGASSTIKPAADSNNASTKPPATEPKSDVTTPMKPVDPGAGGNTASNPVTPNSCEDLALKKVYEILIADKHNALGIMFELTAMKLAKRALEQRFQASTFEDLTQRNIDVLQKKLDDTSDADHTMRNSVQSAYDRFGKHGDLVTATNTFDEDQTAALDKAGKACYFNKSTLTRFRNDEASSYILAVSVGEPTSGLTASDAAIVWIIERARRENEKSDPAHFAIGKAQGNLLNISTRVTRYLGRIDGGRNLTAEQMDALIAEEQKPLNSVIQMASVEMNDFLQECLSKAENCPNCSEATARYAKFQADNVTLSKLQEGLLETVARADDLKIGKDLRGQVKGAIFDLSHFASSREKGDGEATIPKYPPRGTKDACGTSLRKKMIANHNAVAGNGDASSHASGSQAQPKVYPGKGKRKVKRAKTPPVTAPSDEDDSEPSQGTATAGSGNPPADPNANGGGTGPAPASVPAAIPPSQAPASGPPTSTTRPAVPPAAPSANKPAVAAPKKPAPAAGLTATPSTPEEFYRDLADGVPVQVGDCKVSTVLLNGNKVIRASVQQLPEVTLTSPAEKQAFIKRCMAPGPAPASDTDE